MFDIPPTVPVESVQQQCHAVYSKYIHPAPEFLVEKYKERESKAKDAGVLSEKDKSSSGKSSSDDMSYSRQNAIKSTGIQLGAQHGLRWRYKQIEKLLNSPKIQNALNVTFDFSLVTGKYNILYPVIHEVKEGVTISSDGQSARKSRITWEIAKPSRIVPVTPTWRDYLYQPGLSKISIKYISEGLMPFDKKEKRMWVDAICNGYAKGVKQANMTFSDRMQALVSDYKGMLRFRSLVKMNVVTPPKVIEGRLGVTVNGTRQKVNVDDRMLRITTPALFTDKKNWKPVITLPEESTK